MASIEIKTNFKLDEINTVVSALQQWRVIQSFNAKAVAATEEERLEGAREVLLVEQILRTMGVEPIDLKKTGSN